MLPRMFRILILAWIFALGSCTETVNERPRPSPSPNLPPAPDAGTAPMPPAKTCEAGTAPCPDFLVRAVRYDETTHDLVLELSNTSTVSSGEMKLAYFVKNDIAEDCADPQADATVVIPGLQANETRMINSRDAFGVSILEYLGLPGNRTATVQADWECTVKEGDETNNRGMTSFSIADPTQLTSRGLHGYIASYSARAPEPFHYGASFYSAVWSLVEEPVANFQIGLPGTWFTPNNSDNADTPLCPPGTRARDNWPERGPTYSSVFQTMEGGLGYWAGNRYHYGPPKFSMNGTPNCYSSEVASPGWPFFHSSAPLADNMLGIAQLSNRMLIPPDGLPFQGVPQGELIGYGFIALPLTAARSDPQPTGDQNWTLFLNSSNFKGPLAYYLPETWSKISHDYPFNYGRGLDARPINDGLAGTMEINTVPQFQAMDKDGVLYTKIPQLQFPVDEEGRSKLVRDVAYFSKDALYNDVLAWKNGGQAPSGQISTQNAYYPNVSTSAVTYRQNELLINGINERVTPQVFDGKVFGLQWSDSLKAGLAKFPQYFKAVGKTRQAIDVAELPPETLLKKKKFPRPGHNDSPYSALPLQGAWAMPGPVTSTQSVTLLDGSKIIYQWYRFVDQPVFQQYNWPQADKDALQEMIEKIHRHWSSTTEYLPAPGQGTLAAFDPALMLVPPLGMEVGYVPIVVHQENDREDPRTLAKREVIRQFEPKDFDAEYNRLPVENSWHSVNVTVEEGLLWWKNDANRQWRLYLSDGVLKTGEDCPYGVQDVDVDLPEDEAGNFLPTINGLIFSNELYQRQP